MSIYVCDAICVINIFPGHRIIYKVERNGSGMPGNKISRYIIYFLIIIFVPYLMTLFINGAGSKETDEIKHINSGRDVIIQRGGQNILIDVEEYLSCILPGLVEPGQDAEMIEAQAVALRTRIYYAMGEETVIDAKKLGFMMYDDDAYIKRWGKEQYKSIKKKYEQAVINTQGKTLSQ